MNFPAVFSPDEQSIARAGRKPIRGGRGSGLGIGP